MVQFQTTILERRDSILISANKFFGEPSKKRENNIEERLLLKQDI